MGLAGVELAPRASRYFFGSPVRNLFKEQMISLFFKSLDEIQDVQGVP